MVTGFLLITGFGCIAVDHLSFVHGFESDRMFVNVESFSGMQECLSNTFSSFQQDPIQFKNKIRKAGAGYIMFVEDGFLAYKHVTFPLGSH